MSIGYAAPTSCRVSRVSSYLLTTDRPHQAPADLFELNSENAAVHSAARSARLAATSRTPGRRLLPEPKR